MDITTLGEPLFDSPLSSHISDKARVLFNVVVDPDQPPSEEFLFELAGPREKIFFDPKKTRAGIVTCGGLCPGLNNVIRSLVLELHHGYGVREILGFVDGYQGLDPWRGSEPIPLTPETVEDIHKEGGSILNTSRGPVDVSVAVDMAFLCSLYSVVRNGASQAPSCRPVARWSLTRTVSRSPTPACPWRASFSFCRGRSARRRRLPG